MVGYVIDVIDVIYVTGLYFRVVHRERGVLFCPFWQNYRLFMRYYPQQTHNLTEYVVFQDT